VARGLEHVVERLGADALDAGAGLIHGHNLRVVGRVRTAGWGGPLISGSSAMKQGPQHARAVPFPVHPRRCCRPSPARAPAAPPLVQVPPG
jgi:hypothetical protein